jgi:protein-S-isoprenylcysteine O-methyltransferase Ste14
VQAEERLLAERFQESFIAYRGRVPAYLPFLR